MALAQLLNHLLTVITTITVRTSNNTKRKDAIHFKTETVFECNRCRCSDSSDISKGIRGALDISSFFFFHTLPPSHPPQPPPPLESYQDNLLVHPSDRDPDLSILN